MIYAVRECGGMREVVRQDSKVASELAATATTMSKGFGCGSGFDTTAATAVVVADSYRVAGIYWVSKDFDIAVDYYYYYCN